MLSGRQEPAIRRERKGAQFVRERAKANQQRFRDEVPKPDDALCAMGGEKIRCLGGKSDEAMGVAWLKIGIGKAL
jgi:hypothetical protein